MSCQRVFALNFTDCSPITKHSQNKKDVHWSKSGNPPSHWLNLKENDSVVFYKKSRLYFFGVIYTTIHNKELAESLWGENTDGKTWEYIYFLKDGKQIDTPYVPGVIGNSLNYIRGSVLLNENRSSSLLNYLRTKEIDLADEDQIGNDDKDIEGLFKEYIPPLDKDQLLKKIHQIAIELGSKTVKERIRIGKYLARNPAYPSLVKKQANYICDVCGATPFIQKNGLPYAVAHHIDELAVTRIDNPLRMICVCPTCHAVIHYGNDSALQSRRKKS